MMIIYRPRYSLGSTIHTGLHRRFYADQRSPLNHYDILGVPSSASAKEIKTAFYNLSKKHHPDVNSEDVDAAVKFSSISNAYDILSDPIKRKEYDRDFLSQRTTLDPYVPSNRHTYRAYTHHNDFQDWQETNRQQKAKEPKLSKFDLFSLWLTFGVAAFLTSRLMQEIHLRPPSYECRSRFVNTSKPFYSRTYSKS